jgi:uncharacterized RDD family membrane protein YckC
MFLYSVIFDLKLGQSPGRMIMKLNLISTIKGEKITLLKVVIRALVFIPIFPFSLLWIIDPLYLLFTGNRLSDIFAKTQIVEEVTL